MGGRLGQLWLEDEKLFSGQRTRRRPTHYCCVCAGFEKLGGSMDDADVPDKVYCHTKNRIKCFTLCLLHDSGVGRVDRK